MNPIHVGCNVGDTAACPFQMPGFSPGFLWGPCCTSSLFLCHVICFVSLRYVSCVYKVASFSGLSIRDFPFFKIILGNVEGNHTSNKIHKLITQF